jgi:hypothetical protein
MKRDNEKQCNLKFVYIHKEMTRIIATITTTVDLQCRKKKLKVKHDIENEMQSVLSLFLYNNAFPSQFRHLSTITIRKIK